MQLATTGNQGLISVFTFNKSQRQAFEMMSLFPQCQETYVARCNMLLICVFINVFVRDRVQYKTKMLPFDELYQSQLKAHFHLLSLGRLQLSRTTQARQ